MPTEARLLALEFINTDSACNGFKIWRLARPGEADLHPSVAFGRSLYTLTHPGTLLFQ